MLHSHRGVTALAAAMVLGGGWAQPSLAVATYDLDGAFFFQAGDGIESGQLTLNLSLFEPVFRHEGNGEGSALNNPGLDTSFASASARGSAGASPLPTFSASEVAGEFVVDAATLLEQAPSPSVTFSFNFDIDLAISVSDPASSSASAGYEVLVFADDLLLFNLEGMIDESDLVDGVASLDPNGNLGQFRLVEGTEFFTVQYTLFGDSVSANVDDVPEPRVAWLVAAGLLAAGASRGRVMWER